MTNIQKRIEKLEQQTKTTNRPPAIIDGRNKTPEQIEAEECRLREYYPHETIIIIDF